MAANVLANGVGMIKPQARHPLLPWQIRRQSLNLPIIARLFGVQGSLQPTREPHPTPWSEAVMRPNAAALRQTLGE